MNNCKYCGVSLEGADSYCKSCGEKIEDGQKPASAGRKTLKKKLIIGISAAVAVIALALVLIFAVFTEPPEAARPLTVAELLDLGGKNLLDLDYEQAYENIINKDPQTVDAYIGLAEIYLALDDEDRAIDALRKGLISLPDNQQISAMLSELQYKKVALYADIIAAFKRYEDSGWTDYSNELIADSPLVTMQTEMGISPYDLNDDFSGFSANSSIYYSLHDLNGNDMPELIIGTTDSRGRINIQGVYTADNGKISSVYQKPYFDYNLFIYDDNTLYWNFIAIGGGEGGLFEVTTDGRCKMIYEYEHMNDYDYLGDDGMWYVDEGFERYYDANGNILNDEEIKILLGQYSNTLATLDWNLLEHFSTAPKRQ